MRARGEGNLRIIYDAEDSLPQTEYEPITLTVLTGRQRDRLTNFKTQYASLTLKTTVKDEWFSINRIVVFAKSLWNEYPG
jgi:hypothetical protein